MELKNIQNLRLYAAYLKEREGMELIERPYGFATYKLEHDHAYLQDIYVLPADRKGGRGVELEQAVILEAKKARLNVLYGSIDPRAEFATDMMNIMLKLNYKLSHVQGDLIFMKKDI